MEREGKTTVARKKIEVQGTTESDWVARIEVEVPDKVLALDDPDALSEWVELNVPASVLDKARETLTTKVTHTAADLT